MRSLAVLFALCAAPVTQIRDANMGLTPKSKASIAGIVVVDEARQVPARRARVTVSDVVSGLRYTTITGDDGRFVVEDLAAGRFTLSATRSGFVSIALGATRPSQTGTPVVVTDGDHLMGVVLHLLPGAVIDGTIRDALGAPAADSLVTLHQLHAPIGGARQVSLVTIPGDSRTDDRGHYRLFGLAPGEYVISVDPPLPSSGLRPTRPARPVTGAEIAKASGRMASLLPLTTADTSVPIAPVPVYYPGTTLMSAAEPVRLKAGEEQSGVDFRLEFASAVKVTGTVTHAAGINSELSLRPVVLTPIADDLGVSSSTVADRDGHFTFAAVPPGRYTLTAEALVVTTAAEISRLSGHVRWIASTELLVTGHDIASIALTLQPAPIISGRVEFKDVTPTADEVVRLVINLTPPHSKGTGAKISADNTFAFVPIAPGSYHLSLFPATGTNDAVWWLESVVRGGRDVTNEVFDVGDGHDIDDLVLTLRKGLASVSGRLTDSSGGAVWSDTVVLLAEGNGHYTSAAAVHPSTDGSFSVKGLVPGEYRVAAAEDIDQSDLLDPLFLEALGASGVKINLLANEAKRQDLRIR